MRRHAKSRVVGFAVALSAAEAAFLAPVAADDRAFAGSWRMVDVPGESADPMPAVFTFDSNAASVDGRRCRCVGERTITPTRWYLDLACDDGAIFDLDINRLGVDTLMIAPRPWGQAFIFARTDAGGSTSQVMDLRR